MKEGGAAPRAVTERLAPSLAPSATLPSSTGDGAPYPPPCLYLPPRTAHMRESLRPSPSLPPPHKAPAPLLVGANPLPKISVKRSATWVPGRWPPVDRAVPCRAVRGRGSGSSGRRGSRRPSDGRRGTRRRRRRRRQRRRHVRHHAVYGRATPADRGVSRHGRRVCRRPRGGGGVTPSGAPKSPAALPPRSGRAAAPEVAAAAAAQRRARAASAVAQY